MVRRVYTPNQIINKLREAQVHLIQETINPYTKPSNGRSGMVHFSITS